MHRKHCISTSPTRYVHECCLFGDSIEDRGHAEQCRQSVLCLQVMKVILNALQTASLKAQQPINSIAGGVGKVSPAVAATVHATLERVFDDCQQVTPVHWL